MTTSYLFGKMEMLILWQSLHNIKQLSRQLDGTHSKEASSLAEEELQISVSDFGTLKHWHL